MKRSTVRPRETMCRQCGKTFAADPHRIERGIAKFCSKVCQGLSMRLDRNAYFWSHVQKTDGCWLWQGPTNSNGYGRFGRRPKRYAHRLSYELHNGPIPDGQHVLHKCDNPPCVRPDHLFTGTQRVNNIDRDTKGRVAHGEEHTHAKLSEADVLAIRSAYQPRKVTFRALASQFGVSRGAINDIVQRRTWKHVP